MKLRLTLRNIMLGALPIFVMLLVFSITVASAYCIGGYDKDGNFYFEGDDCFD